MTHQMASTTPKGQGPLANPQLLDREHSPGANANMKGLSRRSRAYMTITKVKTTTPYIAIADTTPKP